MRPTPLQRVLGLIAILSIAAVVLLVGHWLYAVDEAVIENPSREVMIDAIQRNAEKHWSGSEVTTLQQTAPNEWVGKLILRGNGQLKDGTAFDLHAKFAKGGIEFSAQSSDQAFYAGTWSNRRAGLPDFPFLHPRFWHYFFSLGFCMFAFYSVFPLLRLLGWRRLQPPFAETVLMYGVPLNFALAAMQAYNVANILLHWPPATAMFA